MGMFDRLFGRNRKAEPPAPEPQESLSLEEVERWTIPSSLIGYLSPEQQDLAHSLEAYNRFVYEHYTQLPDSLRQTLEQYVETGRQMELPPELPDVFRETKAGAFVSLHQWGRLRGCIGTIYPVTRSLGEEIIRNAISAGSSDSRFPPVRKEELETLTYSVDVLGVPETIFNREDLDPKRYGVIVTSGRRRGVLLPNLEGVETVEQQLEIACQKAGIEPDSQYSMERFEVVRHE